MADCFLSDRRITTTAGQCCLLMSGEVQEAIGDQLMKKVRELHASCSRGKCLRFAMTII